MQLTFLFAILPLLAGVAQAEASQPGLDIRVVKDSSKRATDDALVRRAGESVVNSYTQCEQVCVSLLFGYSAVVYPTLTVFTSFAITASILWPLRNPCNRYRRAYVGTARPKLGYRSAHDGHNHQGRNDY
jgi:uncharacterized membrane protein